VGKVVYTLYKSHVIFSQPCELIADPSSSVRICPGTVCGLYDWRIGNNFLSGKGIVLFTSVFKSAYHRGCLDVEKAVGTCCQSLISI
jgi:hypothetical protein